MINIKLISLLLLALTLLSCKQKSVSEKMAYYYNKKLNNNFVDCVGINVYMKYLLDSIVKRHCSRDEKDTKYCIFLSSRFRETLNAYFFDSKDTLFYKLSEETEEKPFLAKCKEDGKSYQFYYSIESKKLSSTVLKQSDEFRSYFDTFKINAFNTHILDYHESKLILRFWKLQRINYEFYRFVGDSLILHPNSKRIIYPNSTRRTIHFQN